VTDAESGAASVNPFGLSDEELEPFLARLAAAIDDAMMWGWPHPTPREQVPEAFRGPLTTAMPAPGVITGQWRHGAPFAALTGA
jgi:hypothetical protein